MKVRALYPGTFDPITNGHTDIIERASKLFEQVMVAVAHSTSKKTVFNTQERTGLAKRALAGLDNVEVCSFQGLVTNFAKEKNVSVIIRGLRAVSDFEYEFQMASMNRHLMKEIETVFLTPAEHLSYISSSLVREIASLGGDASKFLHPDVAAAVKQRLNNH